MESEEFEVCVDEIINVYKTRFIELKGAKTKEGYLNVKSKYKGSEKSYVMQKFEEFVEETKYDSSLIKTKFPKLLF